MKTILIVDDDKQILTAARKVLSDKYKVIYVLRGEQALEYLESQDCDIILLDIYMPEMDGFKVLEKVRKMEQCSSIPVIFLTADSDSETETRCFREGAVDFIAKPFVPDVMLSRIDRVLEIEELRRNLVDRLEKKTQEVSDIKNKASQDPLTGLWNRVYAEETVNGMLKYGIKGAMMMIDMDNFKSINDNYGHIAGDETLRMFADILRNFSSEEDILCRLGGDEFMVFVKDMDSKIGLGAYAANIIIDFSKKIDECGFDTNTSVSIGIAQAPEDGNEFNKLYNAADKALYHVKQNGKNSYHFFSDRLQAEKTRSAKTVDLKYLQELMNRSDNDFGAYLIDFDSFHHVYNFIRRFVDRSNRDVQTILFTIIENEDSEVEASEIELALNLLEKAIHTSLRRSDVSTKYSSRQIIVILMDTNSENGDMVAERIVDNFNMFYKGGNVRVDYGMARIDSRNNPIKGRRKPN